MDSKGFVVRRSVAAAALATALAAGAAIALIAAGPAVIPRSAPAAAPASPTPAPINVPEGFAAGFAPAVRAALPAVVNVSSSKIVRPPRNAPSPFFNDPFFQQFFGGPFGSAPQAAPRREQSLGSGVIVRSDGYILTNNHVVAGASEVKVALSDKREFRAKVVGTDPKTDIAVLKIDASGLPTLPMGDSSRLEVGNFVLAIGDPFGIGETVTMGIVSATGRGNLDIEDYEDFIQTDAAINPGNSGGALIDSRGRLVGINTAILTGGGGGNQGIGFAIPIDMARHVMEQILAHGKVVRGYLGVVIQEVTPAIAKSFGLPSPNGTLVSDVTKGGPADRAGIEKGDVITAIDGKPVTDVNELRLQISQAAPQTRVRLQVVRDGRARQITVTLGELPSKSAAASPGGPSGGILEGLQVQNLTPQIAEDLGVSPDTRGVLVTQTAPGSAAADAGLRRGDIIQEVNRKPVSDVGEFERAASQATGSVLLLVNRRGTTIYVVVER
jgi:serine protease Do